MRRTLTNWRIFIFGGQRRNHWCRNCALIVHPNILSRFLAWASGTTKKLDKMRWARAHQNLRGYSDHFPMAAVPVDQTVLNPAAPDPGEVANRTMQTSIPVRRPLLDADVVSPADMEEYRRTGLLPVFRREVERFNPLCFEPVTGARVGKLHDGLGGFIIELLVGENKEPFGRLYQRRTGVLCVYKTRSSARRAKSRFLKRLAAGDIGIRIKHLDGLRVFTREQALQAYKTIDKAMSSPDVTVHVDTAVQP